MSNPEYVSLQFGGLATPLTASTAHPLLQDADPALWTVLQFYQALIPIHLGARWDAEFTMAGLTQFVGNASSGQHKSTALALPYDPVPFLQSTQLLPPLLAVFPVEETFSEHTRNWVQSAQQWKVLWVLPPLVVDQYYSLSPFLRAAAKVLAERTEGGHDPGWNSDANIVTLGTIAYIGVTRARYGNIPKLTSELLFPTLELELEVREQKSPTSQAAGQTALAGDDATINVTDSTGTEPLLQTSTQFGT